MRSDADTIGSAGALVLAAAGVTFQMLAAPLYDLGGVRPDFVALAVAAVSLRVPPRRARWLAVAAGLGRDIISLEPLGISALAFLALAEVIARGARGGWCDALLPRNLVVACGLGAMALVRVSWHALLHPAGLLELELLSAAYTLALAAPVLSVLAHLLSRPPGGRQDPGTPQRQGVRWSVRA